MKVSVVMVCACGHVCMCVCLRVCVFESGVRAWERGWWL